MANLTIGDFSRITHLSIKTLRRYHEAGILEPAHVDRYSGYRYYSLDQVPVAQVIHRFRELGMPVREVGELVAVSDPDARAALIARHLDRLESQLEQTREAVVTLRRLLRPEPAPFQVSRRRTEPETVAAVRAVVNLSDALQFYDSAMGELEAVLSAANAIRTGPPGGLYDHELFTDERGAVIVYIPVADPPATGESSGPSSRPPTWQPWCMQAHMMTSMSLMRLSAVTSASTPWKWQAQYARSTASGPAIPVTPRPGGPRSAGRSFTSRTATTMLVRYWRDSGCWPS